MVTHTLDNESPLGVPEPSSVVTRGMVRDCAISLAVMNGRLPQEASKADWEEAKRALSERPTQ